MPNPEDPVEALTHALALLRAIVGDVDRARAARRLQDAIAETQTAIRVTRRDAVRAMNATGMSYAEIGRALDISRAQAKAIADDRPPGRRNAKMRAARLEDPQA